MNLQEALDTDLEFKIPTVNRNLFKSHRNFFQFASSELEYTLENWISGITLGGGESESTILADDAGWLTMITLVIGGVIVLFNQSDASSKVKLRPDVVQYRNGAMFLKFEQKAKQSHLMVARKELVDKLSPKAWQVFPRGTRSIVGFASAGKLIDMVRIQPNDRGVFESILVQNYSVTTVVGRIEFLVALFKFLRYVVTIDGPNLDFHLVPGIRLKTPNGHHVTWTNEGLVKEYADLKSSHQMQWINTVYQAQLPHVEHGIVQDSELSLTIATRIGRKLKDCIMDQTITKELALEHIRLGVQELHGIGFAHCDLCVDNCFVDVNGSDPIAFLDDLEYIRPLNDPPPPFPHNHRLLPGHPVPGTAEELGREQLLTLQIEMIHL